MVLIFHIKAPVFLGYPKTCLLSKEMKLFYINESPWNYKQNVLPDLLMNLHSLTFKFPLLDWSRRKILVEFRLIHHLSYPDGNSINCYIPKHFYSVQYQSVDTAIRFIQQLGKGALLAKTDLENAYKQVPIHPDDFELLGFMVDGKFYYDKTLPFGLSYSCNLFEKFS